MSIPLFKNNAKSPLASGISALPATGPITMSLTPGNGALFPSPTVGYYFPVTLTTSAGQREIFYCTARATDTLTVTRAQEGTTALAFNAGDIVSLRLTAGAISDLIMSTTVDFAVPLNTVAGVDTITALFTAPATTLVTNTIYYFYPAGANTGAVTLNISGTGAKAVTLDGTTPLTAGVFPSALTLVRVSYDGTAFQVVDATALGMTPFIKTLMNDPDAATARTTLGAVGLTGSESVAGVKTFTSLPVLPASTPTGLQAASAYAAFRKNAIINGDFNVWQRGTSFAAIANTAYSADRWMYSKTGVMVHTVSRSTDVPTVAQAGRLFNYSLLVDCTTADASVAASDQCSVMQKIEGYNWLPLAQRPVVLSFWVKATKTGVYCVSLNNSVLDRSFVAEYTINTTDTWEFKTVAITASPPAGTWDYTTGIGAYVVFSLLAGTDYQGAAGAWNSADDRATANQVNACDSTSNDFRICGVQLEAGTVATEFENISANGELELCRRYFQKTFPYATAPAQSAGTTGALGWYSLNPNVRTGGYWRFAPTMRAQPAITYYNPSAANAEARDTNSSTDCSSTGTSTVNDTGVLVSAVGSASATQGNAVSVHLTASVEL